MGWGSSGRRALGLFPRSPLCKSEPHYQFKDSSIKKVLPIRQYFFDWSSLWDVFRTMDWVEIGTELNDLGDIYEKVKGQ